MTWALVWKLSPWIGGAVGALAVILLVFHIKAELDSIPKLKADLAQWKIAYASEKTAFDQSEALRESDRRSAIASINGAQAACDQRVSEARRSANAIRNITHECPVIQNGAIVPGLFDAGSLSDAIGAKR